MATGGSVIRRLLTQSLLQHIRRREQLTNGHIPIIALTAHALSGDKEHVLKFEVRFTGLPCKPEPQVVSGTLDVVADGKVVAAKKVQITVPPCGGFVYSVKFVCGVQPECGCECGPVQPGKYATEIVSKVFTDFSDAYAKDCALK